MSKYIRWLCGYVVAVTWTLALMMPTGVLAASLNHTEAFSRAWSAYDAGQFDDALRIWQTLADQGDANAQINLGALYDNGKGVPEDPATAVKWYRLAALQGNRQAQYYLGLMYANGRGVPHDISAAAAWYFKAAQQGFAGAQFNLGLLCAEFTNLCAGDSPAKHQSPRAVKPGSDVTQFCQNMKDASGVGADKNKEIAIEWFYKSGLSYLEEKRFVGAWEAVDAINSLIPEHPLEQGLRQKIRATKSGIRAETHEESVESVSIGTAWPISSRYVVTNNHVVTESNHVVLINKDGQEINAWSVVRDEVNDIALLEVSDSNSLPPALPLSDTKVRLGARVFTIGFPGPDVIGKLPTVSDGVISGNTGLGDNPGSYQTTVPIQPGNSGGPLLNMNGEVVGMVTSMIGIKDEKDGSIHRLKNASCARKVELIKDLLLLLPQQEPMIKSLPTHSGSLKTLSKRLNASVLIVVATR
jgi:S1-C subfamily serine protease